MVIWNYRGYGRSQGGSGISPTAIMKDGEKVYQYVKSNLVDGGKIGIHGESLGGCVASHVARTCQVDFVFSDRAFASLTAVVQWGFGGPKVAKLFGLLTGWREECWVNFHEACREQPQGYKLLGCDSNDTIIVDLASLKTALARSQSQGVNRDAIPLLRDSIGPLCEMISDFEIRAHLQPQRK